MQFNVEDELAIDASSEFSFSTEDLEQIDLWSAANVNHSIPIIQGSDGPLVSVSVEQNEEPHRCEDATNSPYSSFREKQGSLSVSDIASPAWCEVQFTYGLQQYRTLPLEERPISFVTPAGNEIKVLQRVAERNDKVMKAGTAVHKKLEVELYQEAVLVETQSDEERWALRLLDFLVRLQSLQHDGICRELQVAGIIEDQLVTGIVDEIRVARTPAADSPFAKQRRSKSPSSKQNQKSLDSYFSRADGTSQSHSSVTLEIIDNKTRYNRTVPQHIDTLPSRLQLMLYYRLVSAMLDREITHFIDVWRRKQLDPAKLFSEYFKKELNVIAVDNGLSLLFLDANCLEDMLLPYHDTIDLLGINREPSKWLFLVYRARDEQNSRTHGDARRKKRKWSKYDKRSRKKRLKVNGDRAAHTVGDDESEESTISEEWNLAKHPPTAPHAKVVEDVIIEHILASTSSPKDAMNPSTIDRAHTSLPHANVEAPIAYSDSSSNSESESYIQASESQPPSPAQSGIIGTKKFQYNESLLHAHFASIMEWWRGKRLAKGVEIEQTYRCNSCEYSEGCEWRAMKAEEFAQKNVARRTISTDSKDAHNSQSQSTEATDIISDTTEGGPPISAEAQ